MIRIQYTIPEDKATIIAAQQALGNVLFGEANVTEGNFLVFQTPDEQIDSEVLRKIGKALFNHENRIRALEGKPLITREQFIAALKSI